MKHKIGQYEEKKDKRAIRYTENDEQMAIVSPSLSAITLQVNGF